MEKIDLSGNWDFKNSSFDAWKQVRVPHDWAIAGPFDFMLDCGSGMLPWRATGEYRRSFSIDIASGDTVYLDVEGAMSSPGVFINGEKAGGWDYGYMSFTLDVTKFVHSGKNEISISCDTTKGYSRFYCGGGLFRPVYLRVYRGEHIMPGTLAVIADNITAEHASVQIRYESSVTGLVEKCIDVEKPHLWSPDDPYLYEMEVLGEKIKYGIRTAVFTADDGFHINGSRMQIFGACLHSDLGILGMAYSHSAAKRYLRIMKDMGVNAIRTSHNAVAPDFLDLCDEMGFVVWNECYDKWDGSALRSEGVVGQDESVIRNLKTFVRRDRNHPCVVAWSIGNEIPLATDDFPTGVERGRCAKYREAVLSEDPTRQVGIGAWQKETCETMLDLDVTGWNYARRYMPMKEMAPGKPIVYTESGSSFSDYGFYENPPAAYRTDYSMDVRRTSGYDHTSAPYSDIPDVEFFRMEKDRFVAGEFIWTGIDYLGEPSPMTSGLGWEPHHKGLTLKNNEQARSSYYGAVDLTGVPKDRFYIFRSYWNTKSHTVHILPHWNWKKGDVVPVYVYSDGDEAELFLNGVSLERRRKVADIDYPLEHDLADNEPKVDFRDNPYYRVCDKYRFRWNYVEWKEGELKAVAYKNGQCIGESIMRTASEARAVSLSIDPYSDARDDIFFVQADVVDENGVRDPLSMKLLRFSVEGAGEIAAVGNGNPRSYRAFSGTEYEMYFGKAVVAIRRTGTGTINVRAVADGLDGCLLTC